MKIADLGDIGLHHSDEGPSDGPPLVFLNGLGTDLRLWDPIIPLLPHGLRKIRFDMRGQGLSSCPPAPYAMGTLVRDAERLMDHLGVRDAVLVGISIGGMVAQGLAVKRLDLVRAMVLSNTATRIGTREIWESHIATARAGGIEALAETTVDRWFSRRVRATPERALWHHMLTRQPAEGYVGGAAAIAGSDFYATTATLTLPTLVIAGSEDGSTPPDLVRETAALIKGARFHLIRGAGHLSCVEKPAEYAEALASFLGDIGHNPG